MKKIIVIVVSLFAVIFGGLAVSAFIYSPEYMYRILRYQESDVDDILCSDHQLKM